MPDTLIVILATFPALAVVAIVVIYFQSRCSLVQSLVETNAMLSHLCRKATDAAVCSPHDQLDRIQSENELLAASNRKPREQFNQQNADLYGPQTARDVADLQSELDAPAGSGV